jgi:hypothetical protein
LRGVHKDGKIWEAKFDADCLKSSVYEPAEIDEKRKCNFKEAWTKAFGPKAVATIGNVALDSFVAEKGYTPIGMPEGWKKALEGYDVPSDSKVLSASELTGKEVSEATPEMNACTKKVWGVFETFKLTNGKHMPKTKKFIEVMDGGSQTHGYYVPGEDIIYLHENLGGKMMFKVALEEITHYTTGSDDKSRDIQDFLFNLITEIAF